MKRSGAATLVAEKERVDYATKVASPKNLPHLNLIDYYQFLTFRTYDSIDDFLTRLSNENIPSSLKQYKADKYLDHSSKGAYLNGNVLAYLREFLLKQDGNLYELVSFSIMPNHLHILFKQKMEIAKTVQRIKGASSAGINKIMKRRGIFWEKGYFDKAIRDEKHFDTVYDYIKNNAVKASLRDAEEREQLTHEEGKIDEDSRKIVLQSLFSRAYSGLLHRDSSPTMPGLHELMKIAGKGGN